MNEPINHGYVPISQCCSLPVSQTGDRSELFARTIVSIRKSIRRRLRRFLPDDYLLSRMPDIPENKSTDEFPNENFYCQQMLIEDRAANISVPGMCLPANNVCFADEAYRLWIDLSIVLTNIEDRYLPFPDAELVNWFQALNVDGDGDPVVEPADAAREPLLDPEQDPTD